MNPVSYPKLGNNLTVQYPEWLGVRARCPIDPTLRRVGMSGLVDILSGVHKYTPSRFMLEQHRDHVLPIEVPTFMRTAYGESYPEISLVGSLGTSSAIGIFVWEILGQDNYVGLDAQDCPNKSIFVWGFPAVGGYMIIVDFGFTESTENENELDADASSFIHPADRYIVGGMTDFSGEGGAAAKQLLAIMMLIGEIYDIPVEFKTGTWEQYEELSELCNKAQEEQLTGEEK